MLSIILGMLFAHIVGVFCGLVIYRMRYIKRWNQLLKDYNMLIEKLYHKAQRKGIDWDSEKYESLDSLVEDVLKD